MGLKGGRWKLAHGGNPRARRQSSTHSTPGHIATDLGKPLGHVVTDAWVISIAKAYHPRVRVFAIVILLT